MPRMDVVSFVLGALIGLGASPALSQAIVDRPYVAPTVTPSPIAPTQSLVETQSPTAEDNLKLAPSPTARAVQVAPPAYRANTEHGQWHCEENDTGLPGDAGCPMGNNHVREKWVHE
jgi:hypothetical protein